MTDNSDQFIDPTKFFRGIGRQLKSQEEDARELHNLRYYRALWDMMERSHAGRGVFSRDTMDQFPLHLQRERGTACRNGGPLLKHLPHLDVGDPALDS